MTSDAMGWVPPVFGLGVLAAAYIAAWASRRRVLSAGTMGTAESTGSDDPDAMRSTEWVRPDYGLAVEMIDVHATWPRDPRADYAATALSVSDPRRNVSVGSGRWQKAGR